MRAGLRPGQPVPVLDISVVGGERFSLPSPYDGMTLVEFYRGRHCPRCHRHLLELSGVLPRLEDRGVRVIAVSMDNLDRATDAHQAWGLGGLRIGYGLTEDQARDWGLYLSQSLNDREPSIFNEPATLWVQSDGTLYAASYGTTPFARSRWTDWLEALDAIAARNYPPRGTHHSVSE